MCTYTVIKELSINYVRRISVFFTIPLIKIGSPPLELDSGIVDVLGICAYS